MKIFLTGASGLVGSAFARAAARRGHQVVGTVGSYQNNLDGLAQRLQLDLTDEKVTTTAVLEVFPDAIVNAAAVSVPAHCESDPAGSERMNVALPALLARLARHLDARLVHLSSEQVFDGTRDTAYSAADDVSPINLYGRQKVASERAVREGAGALGVTVRPPLLMGNSPSGQRSVHERLFADWSAGRTPVLFNDEIRQTCTAENLAEVMVELCERRDLHGEFHWAGIEALSRLALAQRLREHFKLPEIHAPMVSRRREEMLDAVRNRQACLRLDIGPLRAKLKTRPQSIPDQLAELHVPVPFREWYFKGSIGI